MLGLPIDDPGVTAFTAIIQIGRRSPRCSSTSRATSCGSSRPGSAGCTARSCAATFDYRIGWFVISGSLPIAVIGFLLRDLISGSLRSLWVVAVALLAWSVVMVYAERRATQARPERAITLTDALVIGLVQASRWCRASPARAPPSAPGCCVGWTGWPRPGSPSSCPSPPWSAPGCSSSRTPSGSRCRSAPCWSAPRSSFVVAYGASPGCCASSPGTRSRCSCPTGSRSVPLLLGLLATGVVSAT